MTDIVNRIEYAVERMVAAYPDAIYRPDGVICSYVAGTAYGESGCIFGQALMNAGHTTYEELAQWEEDNKYGDMGIEALMRYLYGVEAPYRWRILQNLQDSGMLWGEAYRLSYVYAEIHDYLCSVANVVEKFSTDFAHGDVFVRYRESGVHLFARGGRDYVGLGVLSNHTVAEALVRLGLDIEGER